VCSHVCSVFNWLIGVAVLMYSGVVSLVCTYVVSMCWNFGMAGWGGISVAG